MSNEVVAYEKKEVAIFDPWREANIYANSDMVPKYFRTPENCYVAIQLAREMCVTPCTLIQNMHEIHGKIGIEAKFGIAMMGRSGLYGPIDYVFEGAEGSDSWSCFVAAQRLADGVTIKGPKVSVKMAKDQGWWVKKDKNGNNSSFWPKMTEMMLSYRAATFFIRLHCPGVLFGMQTHDELIDIGVAEPVHLPDHIPGRPLVGHEPEPEKQTDYPDKNQKTKPVDAPEPDAEKPDVGKEAFVPCVCGKGVGFCGEYDLSVPTHCGVPGNHSKTSLWLFPRDAVVSRCEDFRQYKHTEIKNLDKASLAKAKVDMGLEEAKTPSEQWAVYCRYYGMSVVAIKEIFGLDEVKP